MQQAVEQFTITTAGQGFCEFTRTWQGSYLFEHHRRPHERDVVLHLTGDR